MRVLSLALLAIAVVCLLCTGVEAKKAHHKRHRHHVHHSAAAEEPSPIQRPMPMPFDLDDPAASNWTALQDYVAAPDGNYSWTHLPQFDQTGLGYKVMFLNMTSQGWLSPALVSASVWWHFLAVIIPNTLNPDFAHRGLLYITGGENSATTPESLTGEDMIVGAALAVECQTIVGVLFQIPNAPVYFYDEKPAPTRRIEDAIIAYGWAKYILDPSEPQYLLRLPMTKASVRALDAVSEFWQQQSGNQLTQWIAAGASKRGWTTWTLGAVDPTRVVGIIPMVLDELNFVKNIHHHWRAYGGAWSFALKDYVNLNVTEQLDSDNFAKAMSIVDPIVYREVLTMPKLILSTGGDEFLMPDNNDWYWPLLQGEKHFHQFPNLEHSMAEDVPLVLDTVKGFVLALQTNTPRPAYTWTKAADGTLEVVIPAGGVMPNQVKLWSALTIDGPLRRDFRLVALMNSTTPPNQPWLHPVFWNSTDLAPVSNTTDGLVYQALMPTPTDGGWVAFNIQLVFPGPMQSNFRVSTATSILPQTYPVGDCVETSCGNRMV